ncbi:hypothetical protein MUP95_03965, partial [bacterium]|nr:hypothetical protein [bacterium]
MKKKRRWQIVCFFLCVVLGIEVQGRVDQNNELLDLHRDIVLLNLVNGLYLTADQMETLVEEIKEAEEIRKEYQKKSEQLEDDYKTALEDIKNVLFEGQEIPEDLKKEFHQLKEIQYQLEDECGEKLIGLESEVTSLLTENQLTVIDHYKPCTIPPAQGKIGQSTETATEGIVRMLERIRYMPERQYEKIKNNIADSQIDRIERHIAFHNQDEKEAYKQEFLDLFNNVRGLSDQKFFVQKGELARNLLPDNPQIRKQLKNELGRVGQFLLDSALIPILEDRLNES